MLGKGLRADIMRCAVVPKSGVWTLGKGIRINAPFSLTAESELLNKLSVPAHFVALNGSRLNINLKTGTEVSVSGPPVGDRIPL